MKKKFTIYGNCQARVLAEILLTSNSFSQKYKYIPLKAVHEMTKDDIPTLRKILKKSDLIIYQIINESFKGGEVFATSNVLNFRKVKSALISFLSLYFNAYFPHFAELLIPNKKTVKTKINNTYHDYNILYGYLNNIKIQALSELLYNSRSFYAPSFVSDSFNNAINSLKIREENGNIDIRISDYINKNYKLKKLFHTHNHPNIEILLQIANQIHKILKIDNFEYNSPVNNLDQIDYPVYKCIKMNLSNDFNESLTFKTIEGIIEDPQKIIKTYYDTYSLYDKKDLFYALESKPWVISNFQRLNI
jgi:hypothetical protein